MNNIYIDSHITVSVIVPVYNSEKFLYDSLKSLKKQTLRNMEFIIIDDGSSDSSVEIINQLFYGDSRLIFVKKTSNLGYGNSCNLGIQKSHGRYVSFFEPDDLIPPDFFYELYTQAEYTNADIIKYNGIVRFNEVDENSRIFQLKDMPRGVFLGPSYPRFWRTHPSIVNGIYKRDFIDYNSIRFTEAAGASYQDVQFATMLFYANPRIALIDKCKYFYRQHANQSINNNSSIMIDRVIENWEEFYILNSSKLNKENYWFVNIQMYRQFLKLSERFSRCDNRKLIHFYFQCIRKSGLPKIENLQWFGFKKSEIFSFYLFVLKGYFNKNFSKFL